MMRRTLSVALLVVLVATMPACRRATTAPAGRRRRSPTLDVTSWTREDRALHGVSAARRGTDGAVCRAPDAAGRLSGAERRPAIDRVHAGERVAPPSCCRARSRCAPARSGSKAAARGGTLSLGAVVDAPGLSDRHDLGTVTVFADEAAADRRRREAAGGGSGGDRVSEGTAVDQPVRDGAGARGGAADVDSRAGAIEP